MESGRFMFLRGSVGIKRSVKVGDTNFYKVFFKNILFNTNCNSSGQKIVHYICMLYSGWFILNGIVCAPFTKSKNEKQDVLSSMTFQSLGEQTLPVNLLEHWQQSELIKLGSRKFECRKVSL